MRLTYKGTGTIGIEGAGEVSHGESIEVPDQIGRRLLTEQPQNFEMAVGVAEPARKRAPARGGE